MKLYKFYRKEITRVYKTTEELRVELKDLYSRLIKDCISSDTSFLLPIIESSLESIDDKSNNWLEFYDIPEIGCIYCRKYKDHKDYIKILKNVNIKSSVTDSYFSKVIIISVNSYNNSDIEISTGFISLRDFRKNFRLLKKKEKFPLVIRTLLKEINL